MEYRFGPNKPKFDGTNYEWNKLKEKIAWWNEDTYDYPFLTVICPHCGVKNTHNDDGKVIHIECHLMIDKNGKKIYYECPGYFICRYIESPS